MFVREPKNEYDVCKTRNRRVYFGIANGGRTPLPLLSVDFLLCPAFSFAALHDASDLPAFETPATEHSAALAVGNDSRAQLLEPGLSS